MSDRVEIAVDGRADREHEHDDDEKGDRPCALAEIKVACGGDEICEHDRRDGTAAHDPAKSFRTFLKCGCSLSNVTSKSSGTTRVRSGTVMKFESPLQRGTTCRC